MGSRKPSSSTSGFFQALPVVPQQYTASSPHESSDDPVFSRALSLYLPSPLPTPLENHFHDFARLVLEPSTLQHTVDCDTDLPTLHPLTTFGEENKVAPLRTSEGWRALKQIQTRAGVVGNGYPQPTLNQDFNRRVHQFGTLHLWHGSCAVTTCPMAMTDGAAVLLRRHFDDPDGDQPGRGAVFRESYRRLVSLDPSTSWTSGQWMTERSGGSDVRGTETIARRITAQEIQNDVNLNRDKDAHGLPLGPWIVDGFKWFSSATDADMAVLLAQTSKGLSAFYAPLRRSTGRPSSSASETNGVRIQRLKNKLGTKGVPTAELELKGMRAYLVGQEGQGIKEISSILNITRLHTASGSAGGLARGLAVSRAYTLVRKVRGGQLLRDNAQHLAWMANESVKYRASAHFVFLGIALLGATEQGYEVVTQHTRGAAVLIPRSKEKQEMLLRLLTPVMKAQVSLNGVLGLRACMESLGGVGYCENNEDGGLMNIARLFRDCSVNTIWEGTTSVMAEDVLRVVKNPKTQTGDILDDVFGDWVRNVLNAVQSATHDGRQRRTAGVFAPECEMTTNRYNILRDLVRSSDALSLQRCGRDILDHIEAVACACLLMFDATVDGDEIATEIAKRWVRTHALPADKVKILQTESKITSSDRSKEIEMDRRIFLGSATATSPEAAIQARL
ncbi:aidB [Fonsecaea pedrosoi]|nr:aidB [Fonsecaea pedrosoi]